MKKLYFLSGTMCTPQLWDEVCNGLDTYDCVFIDTTEAASFEEIDILLNETLDEKVHVVAFSMGAYAALHFAVSHPNRIQKLLIIAASANGLNAKELRLRKSTINFLESHSYKGISNARALQFLHPKNHKNKALISVIKQMDATLGKEVLIRQLKATSHRVSLLEELYKIKSKVHIIAAGDDALVSAETIKATHQKLSKSTLTILKDFGHMLPLEAPEIIKTFILQFFKES